VRTLLSGVPLARSTEIQEHARAVYTQRWKYASGDARVFEPPSTAEQNAAFIAARRQLVRAAFGGYLGHRAHVLLQELGLARAEAWTPVTTSIVVNETDAENLRHLAHHSLLQRGLIRGVSWFARTPLFRPVVYMVLGLALLAFAIKRRHQLAITLLASAICYELSLMFFISRPEYAHSHWMILATLLGGWALSGEFSKPAQGST
jgi:hypothetical protein